MTVSEVTHRYSVYLFEVWYWQQLLQSGEEHTEHSLQCCIKVSSILHRKHILSCIISVIDRA